MAKAGVMRPLTIISLSIIATVLILGVMAGLVDFSGYKKHSLDEREPIALDISDLRSAQRSSVVQAQNCEKSKQQLQQEVQLLRHCKATSNCEYLGIATLDNGGLVATNKQYSTSIKAKVANYGSNCPLTRYTIPHEYQVKLDCYLEKCKAKLLFIDRKKMLTEETVKYLKKSGG